MTDVQTIAKEDHLMVPESLEIRLIAAKNAQMAVLLILHQEFVNVLELRLMLTKFVTQTVDHLQAQ